MYILRIPLFLVRGRLKKTSKMWKKSSVVNIFWHLECIHITSLILPPPTIFCSFLSINVQYIPKEVYSFLGYVHVIQLPAVTDGRRGGPLGSTRALFFFCSLIPLKPRPNATQMANKERESCSGWHVMQPG